MTSTIKSNNQKSFQPIELLQNSKQLVAGIVSWFTALPLLGKLILLAGMVALVWFGKPYLVKSQNQEPQYQTETATKGTVVVSISASGTISSGNSIKITTKASGTVKSVYVKNGDWVNKGDKIAELTLDDYAQERQSSAYIAYLDAVEAVKTAQKAKTDADIAMWQARQAIADAEDEQEDKNNGEANPQTKEDYTEAERVVVDKTVDQAHQTFTIAELKYKNADADISNTQIKVAAAWQDYQEASAVITASADGVVSSLTLAPGVVIESSTTDSSNNTNSSGSSTTVSSQKIGNINNSNGQFQATVNLTENDITKVAADQKVSLTIDAFDDKTFTGKVLAVDATGSVSSGVTSYPVTILLDPTTENIYPNMALEANIITQVISDVVTVPLAAVVSQNNQTVVRVLADGQVQFIPVDIGGSSDTQTAILSGINEGDIVVTAVTTPSTGNTTSSSSRSVFSGQMGGMRVQSGSSSRSGSSGMPAGGSNQH